MTLMFHFGRPRVHYGVGKKTLQPEPVAFGSKPRDGLQKPWSLGIPLVCCRLRGGVS